MVNVNVVVERGDKVLLVKQGRGYWMGKWALPGGALITGESLEHCAARKTKDESGLDVEVGGLVGSYSSYDPWSAFELQVVLISFKAQRVEGEANPGGDASAIGWFTPGEVRDMHRRRLIPKLVMQILQDAEFLEKPVVVDSA